MLMDYIRVVIPKDYVAKVLEREHISHTGKTKMYLDTSAKYLWPGMTEEIKRKVHERIACQRSSPALGREPLRMALEFVDRPMQSIGLDFFQKDGANYLIMMDHFLGLPYCPHFQRKHNWRYTGQNREHFWTK